MPQSADSKAHPRRLHATHHHPIIPPAVRATVNVMDPARVLSARRCPHGRLGGELYSNASACSFVCVTRGSFAAAGGAAAPSRARRRSSLASNRLTSPLSPSTVASTRATLAAVAACTRRGEMTQQRARPAGRGGAPAWATPRRLRRPCRRPPPRPSSTGAREGRGRGGRRAAPAYRCGQAARPSWPAEPRAGGGRRGLARPLLSLSLALLVTGRRVERRGEAGCRRREGW